MAAHVPVLRILGGLFFVLAGLVYYFGVSISSSASLLFVAAGAAVVLLALFGHRARPGDVAIFVIGLLVLAAFLAPGVSPGTSSSTLVSHSAAKSALSAQRIDLVASTDVGSVDVSYTSRSDLAYQVNFTRSSFPFGFFGGLPSTSISNETRGSTFMLNATARLYDISIAIGRGYVLDVTAQTGTGSMNIRSLAAERLGTVSFQTGTGSISANLTSLSVGAISLHAGTGSVTLQSSHLAPSGARLPISLSTGTGSATLGIKMPTGTAVSMDASAGLGGVTHSLQGFVVSAESSKSHLVATAGDINTATASFDVQTSTGTGSVTVDARFLP